MHSPSQRPHHFDQLLHALYRHGVVDAGAHAADAAMALDVLDARGLCLGDELGVQLGVTRGRTARS